MADPAQIANDMAAHAEYWRKRDRAVSSVCQDTADMIRLYLSGRRPDGRTFRGLLIRLHSHATGSPPNGYLGRPNFERALKLLRVQAAVRANW